MPLGFVVLYCIVASSYANLQATERSTHLAPHVLEFAWKEAAFGVKHPRVRSVLAGMDRLDVDAQKRIGDVALGESKTIKCTSAF